MRKKYSPSPVFLSLAKFYIHPDIYNQWEGDPLSFKLMVKNFLIEYVNESVERYVRNLPFLRIDFPKDKTRWRRHILRFEDHISNFLADRKIVRVVAWNVKGFKGDIIPLTSEEIKRKLNQLLPNINGGFEIGIGYQPVNSALTTLSHEIAHTYFYDISKNPPKSLVSYEILRTRKWYQELEGLAYDLGREILLPREKFINYVEVHHKNPSLENFLAMYSELNVSIDVLAQRLIRDVKIWNACIFWGIVNSRDIPLITKKVSGPYIGVRNRNKRMSDHFKMLFMKAHRSLKTELADTNSDLRNYVLSHVIEKKIGESESYPISLCNAEVDLEIKNIKQLNSGRLFLAIIHPK
jgi:hypothetical protein